jgi:hypothetical protein
MGRNKEKQRDSNWLKKNSNVNFIEIYLAFSVVWRTVASGLKIPLISLVQERVVVGRFRKGRPFFL